MLSWSYALQSEVDTGSCWLMLATHCSQHWSELDSGRDQLTLPACILVTTLSGAETDLRGCFRMNLLIDLNVKFWPWRPGRIISSELLPVISKLIDKNHKNFRKRAVEGGLVAG